MRLALAAASLVLLVACRAESGSDTAVEPPPPVAETAPTAVPSKPAQPLVMTPDGYGPVRIGMPEAQVLAILGSEVRGEAPQERGPEDFRACHELFRADKTAYYMIEAGVLTRITTFDPKVRTALGISVGATEAQVRAAVGKSLIVEPHKYVGDPAKYLLAWTAPERRGYVFETDQTQVVRMIHAGTPSIRYVEGCL